MQLSNYLPISCEAAIKAGNEILNIYNNQEFIIKHKADRSPVTQADMESSAIICKILNKTGFPVITEENDIPGFEIRKNWENYWLVDPLDGTKEFIKRNGEFAINIALISNNIPVLGVIFIPFLKTIYFGIKDVATWKKVDVTDVFDIGHFIKYNSPITRTNNGTQLTIVTSRSHLNERNKTFIARVKNTYPEVNIIESGSSYKLCLLAEGVADVYPRFGPTSEWDTAAGHVFAYNSGIELLSLSGMPILYNKPNLLNPDFIAFNPDKFVIADFLNINW